MKTRIFTFALLFSLLFGAGVFAQGKPPVKTGKKGKPAMGLQTKPKPGPYAKPGRPRPPGSGIRPDCVGPGHRWVPGRWVYNKKTGRQIWIDGYCMTKQGNSIWIEGHYVETPMGLKWVPGRWITRGGYPEYKGKR